MKLPALAARLTPIQPVLRCPLCGGQLALTDGRSLTCPSRHCYDLSAKGYVNLAPTHDQTGEKYDAALFDSRAQVFAGGFYAPVAQAIGDALTQALPALFPPPPAAGSGLNSAAPVPDALHVPPTGGHMPEQAAGRQAERTIATPGTPLLLDAGCGEGYYTRALAARFPNIAAMGLDLSRDAIQHAARSATQINWFVADLTRLPVADGTVDALIDVLTPADYAEFARVLKPEGVLIKVVPAEDYLGEVRGAVAAHLRSGAFSNARVLAHLSAHADLLSQTTVRHTLPVTAAQAQAFLRMTPMTFGLAEDQLAGVTFSQITIALEVLVCRMRHGAA